MNRLSTAPLLTQQLHGPWWCLQACPQHSPNPKHRLISQDTELPAHTGRHWSLGYACGLDALPATQKESQTCEPSSSQRNISAMLHLHVVQNGAAACKVSRGAPAARRGAATGCFGPRGRSPVSGHVSSCPLHQGYHWEGQWGCASACNPAIPTGRTQHLH